MDNVIGLLHLRRMLGHTLDSGFDPAEIRELLSKPYFIPADTPVYSQLRFFQENKRRMALVVDEYGELLGLVTVEDIIEELIGKSSPPALRTAETSSPGDDGSVLADGGRAFVT